MSVTTVNPRTLFVSLFNEEGQLEKKNTCVHTEPWTTLGGTHTHRTMRELVAFCGGALLSLDVVGREQAVGAVARPAPPALVDDLNVGDGVALLERELVVTGCAEREREQAAPREHGKG